MWLDEDTVRKGASGALKFDTNGKDDKLECCKLRYREEWNRKRCPCESTSKMNQRGIESIWYGLRLLEYFCIEIFDCSYRRGGRRYVRYCVTVDFISIIGIIKVLCCRSVLFEGIEESRPSIRVTFKRHIYYSTAPEYASDISNGSISNYSHALRRCAYQFFWLVKPLVSHIPLVSYIHRIKSLATFWYYDAHRVAIFF